MISAPMPGRQLLAKASSTPMSPPDVSCIAWKVRVAKNHSISRPPACPKGASRLCPSPVPNPSRETEKLWTRTCAIARPPQNSTHQPLLHAKRDARYIRVQLVLLLLARVLESDVRRPLWDIKKRGVAKSALRSAHEAPLHCGWS